MPKGKKKTSGNPDAKEAPSGTPAKRGRRLGAKDLGDGAVAAKQQKNGDEYDVDWTHELTWAMYNAIIENEDVKRGLYPPCGANASTQKQGGVKKSDHHYIIAAEIFTGHPIYGKAFEEPLAKDHRVVWGRKIKNRLRRIKEQVVEYVNVLGETGMGIKVKEDVDLSQENAFTNSWKKILNKFPYFLEFRELIAERPNVTPVGLGNSSSDIDISAILATEFGNDDMSSDKESIPDEGDANSSRNTANGSAAMESKKRKANEKKSSGASSKKMKPMDALISIGVEEEKTKQAELSLAETQAKVAAARAKDEIQLKGTLLNHKIEERRQKAERRRLREERKKLALEVELKRMDLEILRRSSGGVAASTLSSGSLSNHSSPYTTNTHSPFIADALSPLPDNHADSSSDGFPGLGLDVPMFPHITQHHA